MTSTTTTAPAPTAGAVARRRRSRLHTTLQFTPATGYFLAVFVAPVLLLVVYSFFSVRNFRPVPDLTLSNYVEAVTSPVFRSYFLRTFRIAAIVSGIVVLVSFPFTYAITFVFGRRRQLLYFLVLVSLFGGYLVRIYAWRNILGREGVLNQSLLWGGLIESPIGFFLNSQFAIVLALVNFLIPMGVLPLYSAMQNISGSLIEAARDLGSNRFTASMKIVLPLSMRGVRAALGFTFIAAAAEWVTPALLGGTGDQMIGNQIAFQFGGGLNWPLGAALAITLVASMIVILSVILALLRRVAR